MNNQRSILLLTAFAVGGLWLAGCGGKTEAPESANVIKPATSQDATPADTTVDEDETTEPAPLDEPASQVAQSQPSGETEGETESESTAVEEPSSDVAATTAKPVTAEAPEADAVAPEQPVGEAASEALVTAYKPASVALGAEPGGTTFKGRVVVKGTVSKPPAIMPDKDAFCIAIGSVPDETLVVGKDGGLANVFVWLRKFPSGVDIPPVPEEPVALDNAKCSFQPHAFVMRVGQSMFIKNDDASGHNTHTFPLRNLGFNQLISASNRKGVEVIYQREEILPITTKCDIHGWMISFHFPIDHPWAAVTDENGTFEITGLPAGELDFRLWHERMGYVERSVKITFEEDQVVEQTFEVDAAKLKK